MAELRYSDKDLKEFEDLINEKLASAREDLDQLQRSLSTETTTAQRTRLQHSK